MMRIRTLTLTTLLGLTLAACSSDSAKETLGSNPSAGADGTMSIVACSLGCNTFQTSQVSCTVNNVFVNEEIRITFSRPVDLSTLKTSTFQVRDTASGLMPPGTFSPDPSDPRGVIYRPLLTFNSSGSPVFGLEAGRSYEILLPGTNLDAGPYIRSTDGNALGTRMRCVVTAGGGINDPVSGAPTVSIRVNQILKDAFGNPVIDPSTNAPFLGPLVQADNAVDIHRSSNVMFTFNDVMNPATLVNKVTGQSPSLRVFVDPDGDVSDPTDWVELFGNYDLLINQTLLTTTVIFNPDTDYPSAGPLSQPLPRRVIVSVPTTVVDLGGNSVANAADVTFVPERIQFIPVELPKAGGEDFTTTATQLGHREDTSRSGSFWGPALTGNNELEPGIGGGSGRLGDLVLDAGEILTLYTDGMRPTIGLADDGECGQTVVETGMAPNIVTTPQFEDQLFGPSELVHDQDGSFAVIGRETTMACLGGSTGLGFPNSVVLALANDSQNITTVLLDNYDPGTTLPGTSTFQVTDGIFEFASLDIAPGAVLRFVGNKPARLFVRGEAILRGRIELNGEDADQDHNAQDDLGGLGAVAGPGGGAGGNGGLRPDGSGILEGLGNNSTTGYPGGTPNPLVTALTDLDGQPGQGFAFPSGTPGAPLELGGGPGGTRWPTSAICSATVPTDCGIPDGTATDLTFTGGLFFTAVSACQTGSMGGPGGGGGRAQSGGPGFASLLNPMDDPLSIPTSPTNGGSQLADATAPMLQPEFGFLVGGSGGGGGGGHAHGTRVGPMGATDCDGTMVSFVSNSGAGGGGGGGALQFQAGARIVLDGVVDATGGKGGEPFDVTPSATADFTPQFVAPGGAGSGGSVLIQTLNLLLPALNNRINISGGVASTGLNNSTGGTGSPGFVHVEAGLVGVNVPNFTDIAEVTTPFDPGAPLLSSDWVSNNPLGWRRIALNQVPALNPLTGDTQLYVPSAMSGAQSCWMRPEGNFFTLRFIPDDDGGNGLPGWTMDIRLDANEAIAPQSYRLSSTDPNYVNSIEGAFAAAASGGGLTSKLQDPEDAVGGTLGSQFIVRFQGARAIKDIPDLCDVPLVGTDSPVQPGSVTPWVLHPAELNAYWDLVFPSDPGEAAKRAPTMIRYQIIFNRRAKLFAFSGVDNVTIKVQPD